MQQFSRRRLLAASMLASPAAVQAQPAFPSQPISLVVPWPAGGGTDVLGRLVAEAAQAALGVPVVVMNRPGASGAIGLREVSAAAPDGYSLGLASNATIGNQYSNPNANVVGDFEWFAFIGEDAAAITARSEYGSLAELIAAAKARPGGLKNANDPPAGSTFVWLAMFEQASGTRISRVNYGGYAPSVTALLSGEVQMTTVPLTDVVEHHRSGKLRVLGVASERRHFLLPEAPTLREAGLDMVAGAFRALVAPKGTPPQRLAVLERGFLAALRAPAFVARAQHLGFDISPLPAAETLVAVQERDRQIYAVMDEARMVRTRAK